MKSLKFRPHLVPLVLSGQKYVTWRLFDDKAIQAGDELDLLEFDTQESFAKATATKVIEKPLGELKDEDRDGHEGFASDDEMYETYRRYYKTNVGPDTLVKIIWFELKI